MRYGREIIRRDAANPNLATGERVQVEVDPDQVRAAFDAGQRFLAELNRLLGKPSPRRRRRRTRRPR